MSRSSQPVCQVALTLLLFSSACGSGSDDGTSDGGDSADSSIIMVASSSPSSATATSTHSDPLYFTPFRASSILTYGYTPGSLTAASAFTARSRYMVMTSSLKYLEYSTGGVAVASNTFGTYADTMRKIVQAVPDSSQPTLFRLDSELHSLYSLDTDGSGNLSFENSWGSAATPSSDRGYVVFAYDSATGRLQAKARYNYILAGYTHSTDSSFSYANYYVQENAGFFRLVASAGSATSFSLYQSPINVAMPTDFNPDSTAYVSNSRVSISGSVSNSTTDMEGAGGRVQGGMDSAYLPQVAATGNNASTAAAASAMLDTIESTLASEGASLRYPKALYLAFRVGLLETTSQSDQIANGTLGMKAVPYVYFTNEANDSGVHHPFMVIASYSITDKPNRLLDVARPPGDGISGGYESQSVTRDATLQLYLSKIPLRNYGEISSLTENTMLNTLNADEGGQEENDVFNYASISAIGVAVDGVVIYPVLNNTLATAANSAEITSNGAHVGQGMGIHYHADGHSALSNDFTLYNIQDYPGQSHPPVIGFGYDGIALFGIYETAYASMEGYSTQLDTYGGHTHGTLGYHYHAHMSQATSLRGNSYTLHALMRGAWKGRINDIPEFWDVSHGAPAYSLSQNHRYVGK